ncbi:MAG: hypothetical protein ACRDHP_16940, partial [Ktedonobacterales bacterium]
PGAICEAIACALPMVVTGAVPGQEEGNIDFILDNGIGEVIEAPGALAATLRGLLDHASPRLTALRQAMRRLSRPSASFDIARLILSYLPGSATPSIWELRRVRRHLAYRYVSRAGRVMSHDSLPRLAHAPIRRVDGMRRALPRLVRERARPATYHSPGLAHLAGARSLLKRELHETIQLRRSSGGRGRDDARTPVGGGRGPARVR